MKDDYPIGVIQLTRSSAEEAGAGEVDKKNCFKIHTKNRIWWLHAERQIEMDIWIECIRNLTSWYENDQLKRSSDSKPQPVDLRRATVASSALPGGDMPIDYTNPGPSRAVKKAKAVKSFRLSTYLASPSPK